MNKKQKILLGALIPVSAIAVAAVAIPISVHYYYKDWDKRQAEYAEYLSKNPSLLTLKNKIEGLDKNPIKKVKLSYSSNENEDIQNNLTLKLQNHLKNNDKKIKGFYRVVLTSVYVENTDKTADKKQLNNQLISTIHNQKGVFHIVYLPEDFLNDLLINNNYGEEVSAGDLISDFFYHPYEEFDDLIVPFSQGKAGKGYDLVVTEEQLLNNRVGFNINEIAKIQKVTNDKVKRIYFEVRTSPEHNNSLAIMFAYWKKMDKDSKEKHEAPSTYLNIFKYEFQ
ncbi:hypothetical protein FJO69_02395 [[Mycoplasma] falconis]|uniref:Uncharacterized protein n=1 Tax=[Mycoplasma] falconis TaxID=92403 RepID=A0A501X9B9_9BACT|nr:hypothetical protein [[Mycoplasma] falconis]TPE57155.1 hypothetical protein FJO69_02395 [[Mycoplasma] falconis]